MIKTHWKKLENPDYIGAYSIEENKDLTVTILEVKREIVIGQGGKKEECTIAYLKNQKPFILNRTNMKTIQKIHNTPYIEDWSGKMITLFVTKIKAFGEDNVECLRIRKTNPTPIKLPELLPTDETSWNNVVDGLVNGYSIEQVKTKWSISKESEEKLKASAHERI
uniref:Uncharacterized protein n=1 Tax=uncultured marine virus TaxID=186617 RepID=A0A0F7L7F5_9VIRU|nr:hypothetical protein [uncultured marine virus]